MTLGRMVQGRSTTGLDALLCRLRDADREEDWQQLHRLQARRLRAVARRILGEQALADDAVQEAFVRLRSALGRYRPGSDERALGWLTVIASRSAIDLQRQVRRHPPSALADGIDRLALEPDRELDADAQRAVADALAALPERQRLSVLLHVVDGLPHKRVGEALDCSERTASSTVHRGLVGLRRELRRRGYVVASGAAVLLPAVWSEAAAAPLPAIGTTATAVGGSKVVVTGGLLVALAGLALVPMLGWQEAAEPISREPPPVPAAAPAPVDPVAQPVVPATVAIPTRAGRDLAGMVAPVVSLMPRHQGFLTFDQRTLPVVQDFGFHHLWVDGRVRNLRQLAEILPKWQALADRGCRLTIDLRAPVDAAVWEQALPALGPAAVAALAVYSDPDHPDDAAAMAADLRRWLAARPAWRDTAVYDLRESFDRSAHQDWTGCFRLDRGATRLEALPALPANRPATGPALHDDGSPNRLGADPQVVADELLVLVAEALADDAERLYIHELLDRAAPQPDVWRAAHSFGLYQADGRQRPSGLALSRLRRLLSAGGVAAATAPVRLAADHPTDLASLALGHADGSCTVLLWRRVERWDQAALAPAAVAPAEAVLVSDRSSDWTVHAPARADQPRQTAATTTSLACTVAAELLVVHVAPR